MHTRLGWIPTRLQKRLLLLYVAVMAFDAIIGWAQSPPPLEIERDSESRVRLSWEETPGNIVLENTTTLKDWRPFPEDPTLLNGEFSVTTDVGEDNQFFRLHKIELPPPDPSTVASLLERGVATQFAAAVQFLYAGQPPIQTDLTPGSIDTRRVSVVRGKVSTRDDAPLSGVTISVLNNPELGHTLSRADGMFDLAVNGGGLLTIDYQKSGFLPSQRQVNAPWHDFVIAPDVVMIPLDAQVTTVTANADEIQVARGSMVSDMDGNRQTTLLFPTGTSASIVMPNGSTRTLSTLNVRATEYTVGMNGPNAMPAALPPNSGYTYAVELSADEAIASGATGVVFSQPIATYVENFLGFPVGEIVPVGFYDRAAAAWVPSDNGRIIKITAITDGIATVDTVGEGTLAPVNILVDELQRLASLYSVGQELWRTTVPHFSAWDSNWGISPPDDADAPEEDPETDEAEEDPCEESGNSVIEVENQILAESIGLAGTPFVLQYQSDRVPGRKIAYEVDIPLSGATLPGDVILIELEIQVAGQFFRETFPPTTNLRTSFSWDGKDVYGRTIQGSFPINIRTGYKYQAKYTKTSRFGYNGNGQALISGNRITNRLTLWRTWEGTVGTWDARTGGLGGWTLSAHHTYDPNTKILYHGDGSRQSVEAVQQSAVISTFAGPGTSSCSFGDGLPATQASACPVGVAVGPDGSVYIASQRSGRVRRVTPEGIMTTFAGGGTSLDDGALATQALLNGPQYVALGPDGSVYISENIGQRIRKVDSDGFITTFAGTGVAGFSGDGGLATLARINFPQTIAVGPDNSVYIPDRNNRRIRKVSPDGIIETVAGTGTACGNTAACGDGGPASLAQFNSPQGIAVGPDGSIYITDVGSSRIRRIKPDGSIHTVAGTGIPGFSGDGGPARLAQLYEPMALAIGGDDSIYIADFINNRIRWMRPDGAINTLAGTGVAGRTGDGGLALNARLQGLRGVAIGPDGSVYAAQSTSADVVTQVRRIAPLSPQLGAGGMIVPSKDGSEVYLLDLGGRHLQTKDSITGALRYVFNYDTEGRLSSVSDGDGNITTFQRDSTGNLTGIVAPFGQTTVLAVNADGYLSQITSPAGEAVQLSYSGDGLLTGLTNPRGHTSSYQFDNQGRLTSASSPTGATKTINRTGDSKNYTVTTTTALGGTTSYQVERLGNGDKRRTTTDTAGTKTLFVQGKNGTQTGTYPDGTMVTYVPGRDPRWGMRVPLAASVVLKTPGGKTNTTTTQRTTTLSDPNDILSLATLNESVTINGRATTHAYHAPTRTFTTTSPSGRKLTLIVDSLGKPLQSRFGGLAENNFDYDSLGRLGSSTVGVEEAIRTTTFTYEADGFLSNITDPAERQLFFTRDVNGRTTKLAFPGGGQTDFAYDGNGNITTIGPPGQPAHNFAFTENNQLTSSSAPTVGTQDSQTLYSYDADRKPEGIERPDGQTAVIQYDNAGRTSVIVTDGGDTFYGYDDAGRLTSLDRDGVVVLNFAYDGSLPTTVDWSGEVTGSVTYAYDDNLRVSSLRVNDADPVDLIFDLDGLLVQAGSLTLTRDATNGFIAATSLETITDAMTYDGFGARIGHTASHNGGEIFTTAYTRDSLGRITIKSETIDGETHAFAYGYDPAGRLEEVRQDNVLTRSYGYDPNGNRLELSGIGGTTNATYDSQDRLVQYGSTTYIHNANGERESKTTGGQTTSYRYDTFGNLTGLTLPDGTLIDYLLDGGQRRVGKKIDGALVQGLLYQDALKPIAELDGTSDVVSRFVYATDVNVPAYLIKGGSTYRIITDHLGSPRLVINSETGIIAQRLDYDEFGNVTLDSNPGFQPFGFAGGLYDPLTGLVHFGARDYDPEGGRWITKDPIGFNGGDANLYGYALGDPVNRTDPSGLIFGDLIDVLLQPIPMPAFGNPCPPGSDDTAGEANVRSALGDLTDLHTDYGVGKIVGESENVYIKGESRNKYIQGGAKFIAPIDTTIDAATTAAEGILVVHGATREQRELIDTILTGSTEQEDYAKRKYFAPNSQNGPKPCPPGDPCGQ